MKPIKRFFRFSRLKLFYTVIIFTLAKFLLFLIFVSLFGVAALVALLASSFVIFLIFLFMIAGTAYTIASWILRGKPPK